MAEVEKVVPAPVAPPVEVAKVEPVVEAKAGETLLGGDTKVSEAAPKVEPKAEEAAKPAEAPKKVVPETYSLKVPEGSVLSQAQVEAVSLFAKEKGLSNDEAQLALEQRSIAAADFAKTQTDSFEAVKGQWLEECKTDKDFGGDKLPETVRHAKVAVERYFPEIKAELDRTGLGNHPGLLRGMARIGREMGSDTLVQVDGVVGSQKQSGRVTAWDYMNEAKAK